MANEYLYPLTFVPPTRDELIEGIRIASGLMGPSSNRQVLSDMLTQAADAVPAVLAPRSLLKKTDITGFEAGILTGREVSIDSKKLCRLIAGMDQAAYIFAFALTLGGELDTLIAHSQRASLTRALFMDAAGSFLAERYAAQMEDHLRVTLSEQGLELSARFSPGYCDWEIVQGQRELFRFLSPQSIRIILLPSGVMLPLKSITGICIAAVHAPFRTPCAGCHKKRCRYRRTGI